MRCFQFMGLTDVAEEWLDKHCAQVPGETCPHCYEVLTWKKVVVSEKHLDSFFGDGPTLHVYRLKNGNTVKEVVQAEPWSSGPVCFLCLELEDGSKIGKWSEEEIDNC